MADKKITLLSTERLDPGDPFFRLQLTLFYRYKITSRVLLNRRIFKGGVVVCNIFVMVVTIVYFQLNRLSK